MSGNMSRRRFLAISAGCSAGLAGLGAAEAGRLRWRGTAMGADAQMVFAARDPERARAAIAACRAEIERLESVFSLYRADSELCRLNAQGRIADPPGELVELMRYGKWIAGRTDGLFDPTIQPLWRLLADHFAGGSVPQPPREEEIAEALTLVDYGKLVVSDAEIVLPPSGSATLNGIAQGYVTDRVADLLEADGWRDVLVCLGETRALPGRRWPVRFGSRRMLTASQGGALATSSGAGTRFTGDGTWHHLLDPHSGASVSHFRSVTVTAPRAVLADALSTALAVAPPDRLSAIAARFPATAVFAEDHAGRSRRL